MIDDLPLDAIEVVDNAGVFSRLYDAWAAVRNLEWMLPVTAGSDAHDVWYVGSAVTRFAGPGRLVLDRRQAPPSSAHPASRHDPVPSSLAPARRPGNRAVNPTPTDRRPR